MEKATFAAGCFWGVEATFRQMPGVTSTRVGYTGGQTENPTYKEVCTDRTGHAEAVEVEFDPAKVPYAELLKTFSGRTTIRRRSTAKVQTGARNTAPRSSFTRLSSKAGREASKQELEKAHAIPSRSQRRSFPPSPFYPAEDYHQQYLEKRGLASCHINT